MDVQPNRMTMQRFRAMAKALLDEVSGFRPDCIEHQLAPVARDLLGWTYNRTAHLPQRREMMREWVDYLDRIKDGEKADPMAAALPSACRGESHLSRLSEPVYNLPEGDHCGESDPREGWVNREL